MSTFYLNRAALLEIYFPVSGQCGMVGGIVVVMHMHTELLIDQSLSWLVICA